MKKLLVTLSLFLILPGCVPAVFIAGAAASGVVYERRSLASMYHDNKIKNKAQNLINNDPMLAKKVHINVATYHRITLMVGQAQTPEQRERAYQLVSSVPGIRRIYNEVTISGNSSSLQRTNDGWLTTKVKTAMIGINGLRDSNIKVVTEASVVYLMGDVTAKQAQEASNVARRVEGVRKVVQVFQIKPANPTA